MKDLERRIDEWHRDVFDWADSTDVLAKMGEEFGELAQAVARLERGKRTGPTWPHWGDHVVHEACDVIICAIALCSRYGLSVADNLERVFEERRARV